MPRPCRLDSLISMVGGKAAWQPCSGTSFVFRRSDVEVNGGVTVSTAGLSGRAVFVLEG